MYSGFKEADLFRVGCSRSEVISLSLDCPSHLKLAGVSISEIFLPDVAGIVHAPSASKQHLGGYQGLQALRQAGYSTKELSNSPCHTAWDIAKVII